jgi:hypothetical protein
MRNRNPTTTKNKTGSRSPVNNGRREVIGVAKKKQPKQKPKKNQGKNKK